MSRRALSLLMGLLTIIPGALHAATYLVGPTRTYQQLQQVAGLLNPGDVVEVDGNNELIRDRPRFLET